MRNYPVLILALLVGTSVLQAGQKPSEASIREILELTKSKRIVEGMLVQVDHLIKNAIAQASKGRESSLEVNAVIDRMQSSMMALMKAELDWSVVEPLYISVYRDIFSQEEVDGMIAFYRSPVGMALTEKLPLVMERSMGAMQARMGPMMQKLEVIQRDALKDLESLGGKPR